jgi:hypothetical protein
LTSCPPRCSPRGSFLSLAAVLPATPFTPRLVPYVADIFPATLLAASLVYFCCRRLSRCAALWIARFFLSPTAFPPLRSQRCVFLSLVEVLPAVPLAVSLVSFSCRRLGRRAARCIACFVHSLRSCPRRHSQYRSFLSLADDLPAAPLTASPCPPCRSLHRSFLSPADATPAALLAASLVSFSRRRHARRATRCIARFFLPRTTRTPRRLLNRSFHSLFDALPAAPLAEALVCFSRR